jgi:hypothetical protein
MKGNAQFFDDCVFLSITLQWLKDILNPDFFQPQSLTRDFSTSIFNHLKVRDWSLWFKTPGLKNPGLKCPLTFAFFGIDTA